MAAIEPRSEARSRRTLRVLALASYPEEAAATRYRITQLINPLEEREIAIEFVHS